MERHLGKPIPGWRKSLWLWTLLVIFVTCTTKVDAGRKGHHGGGSNRLMELLTAGIVAKVLQKQDGGGGGGGSGYYHVPIPFHVGGGGGHHHARHAPQHHHVTEKIIPIPIPQHTTRIIHINAGQDGDGHQQLNQLLSGAGGAGSAGDGHSGDYNSHHQYDGGHGGDQGYESQKQSSVSSRKPSSSAASTTIQHLLFSDSGIINPPGPLGMPMQPPLHASGAHRYYAFRRPMVGLYPYDTGAYLAATRPMSTYTTQRWPSAYGSGLSSYGSGMSSYGSGMSSYGSGMSSYGSGMNYYGKAATSPMIYAAYPPRTAYMSSTPQLMISKSPYRRWM